MKLATLMSSALIACTSVKAGPRISRKVAEKLNGPKGGGALRTGPASPAVVVKRKGLVISTVTASDLLMGIKP